MYLKRLRELREDHDLKQTDIAKLLGIHQPVYSRYERGYQNIPLEHLVKLADFYQVSLDYIFERTEEKVTRRKNNVFRRVFVLKGTKERRLLALDEGGVFPWTRWTRS